MIDIFNDMNIRRDLGLIEYAEIMFIQDDFGNLMAIDSEIMCGAIMFALSDNERHLYGTQENT